MLNPDPKQVGRYVPAVLQIIIFPGDPSQVNMDSILILAEDSYYVAQYDAVLDCIVDIQQVPLADIIRIEFGQGWKSQRKKSIG
jgi:hypothetical protein